MGSSLDRLLESSPAPTAQPEQTQSVTPNFDSITKLAESLQRVRAALTAVGYDTLLKAGLTTENKGQYFNTETYFNTPQNQQATELEEPLIAIGYGARFGEPTNEDDRESFGWIISDAALTLQKNRLLKGDRRNTGMQKMLLLHRHGLIDCGDGSNETYVDIARNAPAQPIVTIANQVRTSIKNAYKDYIEERVRIEQAKAAAKLREERAKTARAQTVMTLSDLGRLFDHKTLENIIFSWREFYTVLFQKEILENPVKYRGNAMELREWADYGMSMPTPLLKIAPPCNGPSLYETLLSNAERFGVTIDFKGKQITPMEFDPALQFGDNLLTCELYNRKTGRYSDLAMERMRPLQPTLATESAEDTLVFLRDGKNILRHDHYRLLPDLARAEDVILAFIASKWCSAQPGGNKELSGECNRLFGRYPVAATSTCTTKGEVITLECTLDSKRLMITSQRPETLHSVFISR